MHANVSKSKKTLQKKMLVLSTVWPEPNATAAGIRMLQLLHLFLSEGHSIVFASTAAPSSASFDLQSSGIVTRSIRLNCASFDAFVQELAPQVVLFDRFATEEQFGWRVAKHCPRALRILDTEDLHCLRRARASALKMGKTFSPSDLFTETAFREIASIKRCDLSLIISSFEMDLLKKHFELSEKHLHYLPFLIRPLTQKEQRGLPQFSERRHFVTIGSFRHAPNWDSVLYLKQAVWPLLRKELPEAELHVYGSYPTEKAVQLTQSNEGFYVKGWAKDAETVLRNARVCLAPLRFGAGLKGKFLQAMQCGLPSVTTAIGAEGMQGSSTWAGVVAEDPSALASGAKKLYTEAPFWQQAQEKGFEILKSHFDEKAFVSGFLAKITDLQKDIKTGKETDFYNAMLAYHSLRSAEFMARWIEEKNSGPSVD